jgi:hypothetical protein
MPHFEKSDPFLDMAHGLTSPFNEELGIGLLKPFELGDFNEWHTDYYDGDALNHDPSAPPVKRRRTASSQE